MLTTYGLITNHTNNLVSNDPEGLIILKTRSNKTSYQFCHISTPQSGNERKRIGKQILGTKNIMNSEVDGDTKCCWLVSNNV